MSARADQVGETAAERGEGTSEGEKAAGEGGAEAEEGEKEGEKEVAGRAGEKEAETHREWSPSALPRSAAPSRTCSAARKRQCIGYSVECRSSRSSLILLKKPFAFQI